MFHEGGLLPRPFNLFRAALRFLRNPHVPAPPARRPERRVRPQVEALEDRLVLSAFAPAAPAPVLNAAAISHLTRGAFLRQFNGVYTATLIGQVTVFGSTQPVQRSIPFLLTNGVVFGTSGAFNSTITSKGKLTLSADFQGAIVLFQGRIKISHHVASASGTWMILAAGIFGEGTWSAQRNG